MDLSSNRNNARRPSPWRADEAELPYRGSSGNEPDGESSIVKTLVKILSALAVVLVAGLGYYYFFMRQAGPSVGIEFSKPPDQVFSGQPFTLGVSFSNYSDQILKNAKLSIVLPDGVSFVSGSSDQRVMEQDVGDLGPGSVNQQSFKLIVTGESQTLKHIGARLGYTTTGSSAEFQTESGVDVPIGQPAVSLNFEAPQQVFSGENFDVTVRYRNDSNQDLANARLVMDYPPVFQFGKSSIDPSKGNNQWDLGAIPKGGDGVVTITGSVVGSEQSYFNFHGTVTAGFSGRTYGVSEQTATVAVSVPPISVIPVVNGAGDYIAHIGDNLTYTLRYKNNSNVTLEGVSITAAFTGGLFDFSAAKTDASFDPFAKTFTWITANTPALAALAPGQEGSVDVSLKLADSFPIRRVSDKNYVLKLHAEIQSPTVPPGTHASKTMSVADLETKVGGKVSLESKALWRDAASGILNKGPYPPKVNQPTQYAVHWIVTNYSTDISGVQVTSFLQSGARWTGAVKSNIDSKPAYDSTTGKITWDVGTMIATKGIISPAAEAIFQVELTPVSNQLNQMVTFLGDARLQAQDTFTGTAMQDSAHALSTDLPEEKTIGGGTNRTVQQ